MPGVCRGLRSRRAWREALKNLGDPSRSPEHNGVERCNETEADRRREWESDRSTVLGDGRADHMGKGATEQRSPHRKHDAEENAC